MLKKVFKNALLSVGLSVSLMGCAVVDRAERFANYFEKALVKEYTQRTDPNGMIFGGRYSTLQKIGELQRQVYAGQITIREAKEQVTQKDYDQAFDAVQAIGRGALQDAFRLSNPEVRIVENLPTIGTLSLTAQDDKVHEFIEQNYRGGKFSANEDFSDFLKPRFQVRTSISDIFNPRINVGTSLGRGKIDFEPTFQLGRLYSITYETKNETYEHEIRYRHENWFFRVDIKHAPSTVNSVSCMAIYTLDALTTINARYVYNFLEKDHTISVGFAKQF